jgi:hypothetical protein
LITLVNIPGRDPGDEIRIEALPDGGKGASLDDVKIRTTTPEVLHTADLPGSGQCNSAAPKGV